MDMDTGVAIVHLLQNLLTSERGEMDARLWKDCPASLSSPQAKLWSFPNHLLERSLASDSSPVPTRIQFAVELFT